MYTTIPKVTFLELQEDIKRIMAVIGIFSFEESFLAVDEDIDPRITFKTLVERANATFSRHFPLIFIQRVNFNRDGIYTFVDNFNLYVAGTMGAESIQLIPDAVVSVSSTRIFHAKWGYIPFTYQPPYLILKGTYSGLFYAKTLCKYRIYFDPLDRTKDAIYYIEKNTPVYDIFIKQLVYDVAFFMLMAKQNYNITELPIEIFGGLENLTSELRSELDTLYNENPRNYLILY